MPPASLSVLVPIYNERATIERLLNAVVSVRTGLTVEVLACDDGSSDGTREILSKLSLPGLKVIFMDENVGRGGVIKHLWKIATGDIFVHQDADLEYDPREYPLLLQPILEGKADVVYGSRFLGRHRVFLFTHYAGNRLLTLITNVLYNTMLTDMETCYKVMRTEVLRSMKLESDGFGIEPELTAKIFKRHYRVYEVPITYDGRGYEEGKKITWRDGIVALWVLLKYRFTE
jgi:glycosyltransferase involved in cell wall biosynthesis